MSIEKNYRYTGFFFIAIWVILTIGFYQTYIQFFPNFAGFKAVQHFHGTVMLLWVLLLIVQPFLIRMNKLSLHKAVGKSSYVLAPLVVISLFAISKFNFEKIAGSGAPPNVPIAVTALNLPGLFSFAIFYILAMVHKKNTPVHMRYMIGTALLMIGPGFGRILGSYFNIPFEKAVTYSDEFVLGIAFVLLVVDIIRKNNFKPYLTIFIFLLLSHICWLTKMGTVWQTLGGGFAKLFF